MTTNLHPASEERDHAVPRCPQCSALRTAAAGWCTQCYLRFGEPHAQPGTGAAAEGGTGSPDLEPAGRAADADDRDGLTDWDARYREAATQLDDVALAERAESLMAELSSQSQGLDPATSSVARLAGSPGGKLLLIAGGGAVLLGVGLLAMFVLGQLL